MLRSTSVTPGSIAHPFAHREHATDRRPTGSLPLPNGERAGESLLSSPSASTLKMATRSSAVVHHGRRPRAREKRPNRETSRTTARACSVEVTRLRLCPVRSVRNCPTGAPCCLLVSECGRLLNGGVVNGAAHTHEGSSTVFWKQDIDEDGDGFCRTFQRRPAASCASPRREVVRVKSQERRFPTVLYEPQGRASTPRVRSFHCWHSLPENERCDRKLRGSRLGTVPAGASSFDREIYAC